MITVIADIRVRPGHRSAVLKVFEQLIPAVLAEEGCAGYTPMIDVVTQLEWQHTAADSITLLEKWQSVAHLEKHLQTPHIVTFQEQVKDDVLDIRIQILTEAQ